MKRSPLLLLVLCATPAFAQWDTHRPRFEAGVQLSVIDLRGPIGEKPLAAGGRASARVWRFVDADFEINRFPIGGAQSNFPGTEVLIGGRAGYYAGPFGLFGKVRPGFIAFDKTQFGPQLGRKPALDFGGILEIYSSYHVAVRIDYSDLVTWYGAQGTHHQLRGGFGINFWF